MVDINIIMDSDEENDVVKINKVDNFKLIEDNYEMVEKQPKFFMPLVEAASQDNHIFEEVLSYSKNLNVRDSQYRTSLMIAAQHGKIDNINSILKCKGVDINAVDNHGNNFLVYLCKNGDFKGLEVPNFLNSFFDNFVLLNHCVDRIKYTFKSLVMSKIKGYPDFYKDTLTPELKDAILNDDLKEFEHLFMSAGQDIFLIAAQYNATKIASYCIQMNHGLHFISSDRLNGFTYICFNANSVLANLIIESEHVTKSFLLTKNTKKKSALSFIPKHVNTREMNKIKRRILNLANSSVLYDDAFKIYKKDDFTFVKYGIGDDSGSYGSAVHVIEKSTGRNMSIKKYSDCAAEVISDSTMKEITYLRWVNKMFPGIAVKIYGIYFEDSCIHMVQEYLQYTLLDLYELIASFEPEERNEYIKMLLRGLITAAEALNSMGLDHNDLKIQNIMIDDSGRLRLIDFGLVDYLGLMPRKVFNDNCIMTEYIKAPDAENETEDFISSSRTLNNDVFSIGCIIINLIFGTYYDKYFSSENKLYVSRQNYNYRDHRQIPYSKIYDISPLLLDLLLGMVHCDSEIRLFAKECFQHEYFTNKPTPRRCGPGPLITRINNLSEYNSYILSLERELMYRGEIISTISDIKFTLLRMNAQKRKSRSRSREEDELVNLSGKPPIPGKVSIDQYINIVFWLFEFTFSGGYPTSLDTFINSLNFLNKFLNSPKIPKDNLMLIAYVSLLFACYVSDYHVADRDEILLCVQRTVSDIDFVKSQVDNAMRNENIRREYEAIISKHVFAPFYKYQFVKPTLDEVREFIIVALKTDNLFEYIPIFSTIANILVTLQEKYNRSREIEQTLKDMVYYFVKWYIFNTDLNIDNVKLSKYFYMIIRRDNSTYPEIKMMDFDQDEYDYVEDIVTCDSPHIDDRIFRQIIHRKYFV